MQVNEISGINMDAGLELYDGEIDIYTSVLKSFAVNAPAVIDKIRDVTTKNLPDYIINVHGLKSMSAAIAAEEINAKAKNLEVLAKEGDLPGILADNSRFIENIERLINEIKNSLSLT